MIYAKGNFDPILLAVRHRILPLNVDIECSLICLIVDPVTSVVPTQDSQTVLVTTLDSHLRLMDMSTGKLLNDFSGHANTAYRCRGCFEHGEASVICGDESGKVWAWDLLDVSLN